jgi:hypothetical protein
LDLFLLEVAVIHLHQVDGKMEIVLPILQMVPALNVHHGISKKKKRDFVQRLVLNVKLIVKKLEIVPIVFLDGH